MTKTAAAASRAQAEPEPGYHTRTLVRALSILDAFGAQRRPLAVKDLHLILDLPKPTVSRLAAVLERHGYLARRDQSYILGPKLFELGSLFAKQDELAEVGRPPLEQLSAESLQTSCLGVLMPPDILHVVVVPSASPVHYVTNVGSLAPAHSTGLGKALLSNLSERSLEAVLPRLSLKRYTPKTITDEQRLRRELATIRGRGYATDDEETALGLRCVAMPVNLERAGSVAVSLSGPAADFNDNSIPAFARKLAATAVMLREAFVNVSDHAPLAAPFPATTQRL
jgi:DNA-binding IclR family transcriptional regulator